MGYRTTRRQMKKAQVQEAHTLVISRWLNRCAVGQWTPFEAATEIEKELDAAGWQIVSKDQSR